MSRQAQRDAFQKGARAVRMRLDLPVNPDEDRRMAQIAYPPRAETRPRRAFQAPWWLEVRDGELWGSTYEGESGWIPLSDYVRVDGDKVTYAGDWSEWAPLIWKLLQNPTEQVWLDD